MIKNAFDFLIKRKGMQLIKSMQENLFSLFLIKFNTKIMNTDGLTKRSEINFRKHKTIETV
jgi:hypothetical protein